MSLKTRKILLLALAILALPALAAAPKKLSVLIGGVPLDGKALWYDNQVYVPLESVSKALDGRYVYDEAKGVATVNLSNARKPQASGRAHLKSLASRSYSTGDNLRVLATVMNSGDGPARDIEIICTFGSGYLGEINASVANIPELAAGQKKTVEFWLYEQRVPDHTGGRPYAQPMSVPGTFLARGDDYVYLRNGWERVTHNLQFRFVNPDGTSRG